MIKEPSINHPKIVITVVVILTVLFALLASKIEEVTDLESFFPDYPEMKLLNRIEKEFVSQEPVVVLIKTYDALSPESIKIQADILENIWKDNDIKESLLKPENDSLMSVGLVLAYYKLSKSLKFDIPMEEIIKTMRSFNSKSEIIGLLKNFLKDPLIPQMFKDYTLSLLPKSFDLNNPENVTMTSIYIMLDGNLPDDTLEKVELKIEKISADVYKDTYVYGFRLMNHYYIETEKRIAPAFALSLVLIIILLLIGFKNIVDTLTSLFALFIAVIWTMGFAALLGWKLDLMSSMVPILTFGLGIDFSFHVLLNFKENLKTLSASDAMRKTLKETGTSLFLAMITTAAGFMSGEISSISSMRHFGVLAAVSIFFTFILNVSFVPAIKMLIKTKYISKKSTSHENKPLLFEKVFINRALLITIVLVLTVLTAAGWYYGMRIKAAYDPTGELSRKYKVTKAFEFLNNEFSIGAESAYILVEGDLQSPEVFQEIQKAINNMKDDKYVVKQSDRPKVEWVMEVAPALSYENIFLMLPYSAVDRNKDGIIDNGVNQETLKRFLNAFYKTTMGKYYLHKSDGNFDALLIIIQTNTKMGYHGEELLNELKEDFKDVKAKVSITGMPIIWAKGLNDMRDSMTGSMALCIVFSGILLPFVFYLVHRKLIAGILTVVPPIYVVGWLFLSMKILHIPLNMMTALVGAIVIGMGIDYPIHVANRWTLEKKKGKDNLECLRLAMRFTGKEVFLSALTTLIAFGSFFFLPVPVITQFAITIILGMVYSLIGAILLLPMLMNIFWRR